MVLNHKMYDLRPICRTDVILIATTNFGHLRQAGTHVGNSRGFSGTHLGLLWSTFSPYFDTSAIKASLYPNFVLDFDCWVAVVNGKVSAKAGTDC